MKRMPLVGTMFFVACILMANPFIGRWKMDLAGAANAYILEFVDDSTYSIVEVNVNTPQFQDYSIDEKSQLIKLGKINNENMSVKYSFNKTLDTFSLFFQEDWIEAQFGSSLGFGTDQETESGTPQTQFTKEFIMKLKKGFIDLMKGIPIAVAKKIRQIQ